MKPGSTSPPEFPQATAISQEPAIAIEPGPEESGAPKTTVGAQQDFGDGKQRAQPENLPAGEIESQEGQAATDEAGKAGRVHGALLILVPKDRFGLI
jgi:hypothetical protein